MKYFHALVSIVAVCHNVFCGRLTENRGIDWDPDQIVFPHDLEKKLYDIPLSFAQELNTIEDVSQFLDKFVDPGTEITNRFSGDERTSVTIPKSAVCMPELKTVPLKIDRNETNLVAFPQCMRIERCGGCCSSTLLQCQPTTIETVYIQVTVTQIVPGQRMLKMLSKDIIPVDKHLKCKCGCRIKQEDCNVNQRYYENACVCRCINKDEENKCYRYNSTKFWDESTCTCRCRNPNFECSTGYQFDHNECTCKPLSVKRRFAELTREEIDRIKEARRGLKVAPISTEENVDGPVEAFVESDEE